MMAENPVESGWKLANVTFSFDKFKKLTAVSVAFKVQIEVDLVSFGNKDTYKLLPVLIRIYYREGQVYSTLGD